MTDWRSYDRIAGRYDDVWGSRFEAVARRIWTLASPAAGALVIDVGTGTGIVPGTLGARVDKLVGLIGCDRSPGMLARARARVPSLQVLVADATALPFRPSVFEVATASFVLSHLRNPGAGLREAHRVLKPSGIFIMTSWTATTDPYSEAWSALLAEAVSSERLQEAMAEVAPSEGYFEEANNVRTALTEAGFARVEMHPIPFQCSLSLERFIADRELSSGARFAKEAMGIDRWGQFVRNARETLRQSFGSHFDYSRGVLIGVGHRE